MVDEENAGEDLASWGSGGGLSSQLFWRFLIATGMGLTPLVVIVLVPAKGDTSIGRGLAIALAMLGVPPLVSCVAGWTCPPAVAQMDAYIGLSIFLGSLSITLPTFLVLNAAFGAGAAAMVETAIVVGLNLAGAKVGLAIRAGR